jgi:hypothetical protein
MQKHQILKRCHEQFQRAGGKVWGFIYDTTTHGAFYCPMDFACGLRVVLIQMKCQTKCKTK